MTCMHSALPRTIIEFDEMLALLLRDRTVFVPSLVNTMADYIVCSLEQVSWDPITKQLTPDSALPAWVFTDKLVVKPDQLIKRRGKAGLLLVLVHLSSLLAGARLLCGGIRQFGLSSIETSIERRR